MKSLFLRFAFDESGATAIEYALLLTFIALAIIGAVTTIGSKIGTTFNSASAGLK